MTGDYRNLSFWHDSFPGDLTPRSPLPGDQDVDIAIVGGGFTGLWTAWHLSSLDASLRIAIVEKDIVGFGASGRNGGWALGEFGVSPMDIAKASSTDAALRQMRALYKAVDDIGRIAKDEDIDCHYAKGGSIAWARNQGQLDRIRSFVESRHRLGLTEEEVRFVGPDEARAIGNATDVLGGRFLAPVAALHPTRLVRGLADACERRGVSIYEQTSCLSIRSGQILTNHGSLRAEVIVRATEGYTSQIRRHRRVVAPIYSLMFATEPIPEDVWEEIGLVDRPTFSDARLMTIYGQRTADGRIAFGGRGAPYVFGSKLNSATEQLPDVHETNIATLKNLFPILADTKITHRWGGPLGISRDWWPSVLFDKSSGLASAGGYVGDGVATSKLSGQTLAELIIGEETERTDLPIVGHKSRRWAPEPFRWFMLNAGLRLAISADNAEARTGELTWRGHAIESLRK